VRHNRRAPSPAVRPENVKGLNTLCTQRPRRARMIEGRFEVKGMGAGQRGLGCIEEYGGSNKI